MRKKDKDNTDRLVDMLARGERTFAQIAEELGLDEAVVAQVARGEIRPELYARIKAAEQGFIDEARRTGARYAKALLTRHIRIGMKDKDDEAARKCREYVLSTFLKTAPQDAAAPPVRASRRRRLTRKKMARWAKDNGGPQS